WATKDQREHGSNRGAGGRGARTALSAQEGQEGLAGTAARVPIASVSRNELVRAWMPWVLLSLLVFLWGVPQMKKFLNDVSAPKFQVAGLHNIVVRTPPVVVKPTPDKPTKPEEAVFTFN